MGTELSLKPIAIQSLAGFMAKTVKSSEVCYCTSSENELFLTEAGRTTMRNGLYGFSPW